MSNKERCWIENIILLDKCINSEDINNCYEIFKKNYKTCLNAKYFRRFSESIL